MTGVPFDRRALTSAGARTILLEDDRKGDLSQKERGSLLRWCFLALLALGPMTIEAPSTPSITIAIQPFNDLDAALLLEVRKGIEELFGPIDIVVLKPCELPAMAFYPPRGRYRAEKLLQYLDSFRGKAYAKVLGLTSKDISTTKGEYEDWGIFGLGNLNSTACVVSTFRLKSGQPSEALFIQRVCRVVNHELGHTFGLLHCDHAGCLMRDARGSIKTVDDGSGKFCARCARHIRQALGRRG